MITVNETINTTWKEVSVYVMSNPNEFPVYFWVGTIAPTVGSIGHKVDGGGSLPPFYTLFGGNDKIWFKADEACLITVTR